MADNRHPAYYPYLYFVAVSGCTALLVSAARLLDGSVSSYWILLAILTVITSAFPIRIPETQFKISIEDTFLFTNMVLFGPEAGVMTAALQGFMGSVRSKSNRRRMEFMAFNMGALILSAYVSGQVFFRFYRGGPAYGKPPITLEQIVLPVLLMALVHYLLNSMTVAFILALNLRQSIFQIWKQNFAWTSVTYLTGAWVAALIAVNINSFNLAILGATGPVVYITYFIYRMHREKVEGHLQQIRELNALYLRTVESLALAVDAKDQTTHGHIRRVRAYAVGLARLCGIKDKNELLAIETGALLHDIGKLAIEDYILNKPGRLSKEEFGRMQIHTQAGEEILDQIQFPFPVAKYVRAHHERWDGSGYPDGLKGQAIPMGARILAIADCYDAIRSSRPYKTSFAGPDAIRELEKGAGKAFDPSILALFVQHADQLEREAMEAAEGMPELKFRQQVSKKILWQANNDQTAHFFDAGVCAELVSLCEFCFSLGKDLTLSDLLVHLECSLRRLIAFECCTIFLADANNTLRPVHATGGLYRALRGLSLPLGKGISGWVAAYGRPMLNAGAVLEFQGIEGDLSRLSNALAVPLWDGDTCIGSISIYAESAVRFTEEDLAILELVAGQVAPLIVSARGRQTEDSGLDPVTGTLRMRRLVLESERLIAASESPASRFDLLFIQLRNLRAARDFYGISACEELLAGVGKALSAETRDTDFLARFGRDAFVLLLPGVRHDQLSRRMQHLEEVVAALLTRNGMPVQCRIGSARYPDEGSTIFRLLEVAQEALEQNAEVLPQSKVAEGGRVVDFPLPPNHGVA